MCRVYPFHPTPLSLPHPTTITDTSSIAFSYEDFSASIESTSYSFSRNDVIPGTVVQYENGGALVDIGAKASAFLPLAEAGLALEANADKAQIEDLVDLDKERNFQIISEEDENGQLLVSIRRIEYREAWERIQSLQDQVRDAS